jgi:hypothetical protein
MEDTGADQQVTHTKNNRKASERREHKHPAGRQGLQHRRAYSTNSMPAPLLHVGNRSRLLRLSYKTGLSD